MRVGARVAVLAYEEEKGIRLDGVVTAVELSHILIELTGRVDRWGGPERRWYPSALVQPRASIVVLEDGQ